MSRVRLPQPIVRCQPCGQTQTTDDAQREPATITAVDQVVSPDNPQETKTRQATVKDTAMWSTTDTQNVILVLTLVVLAVQVCIYRAMHNTTRRVERAYVALADVRPDDNTPLIRVDPVEEDVDKTIKMYAFARNWGKTPAQVGPAVFTTHIGLALPRLKPPYPTDVIPNSFGFVVPGGAIKIEKDIPLSKTDWASMQEGAKPRMTLWILGYIDYVDEFDQRHRGHYCRRCRVGTDILGLEFETTEGYNYDD